jgi:SAM-dependent methyltransferase
MQTPSARARIAVHAFAGVSGGGVSAVIRSDRLRLVLSSFLMLFLELALIRWTSEYIVYLAFFSNFILLASFLGIGLGFLSSKDGADSFAKGPAFLALLVVGVAVFPVGAQLSSHPYVGLAGLPALPEWIELPVLFVGTVVVLETVGAGVARYFRLFEPLEAYRLDILGSILGIGAFTLLSFAGAPPVAWGLMVVGLYVSLLWRRLGKLAGVALVVLIVTLGAQSLAPGNSWSPYYRISVTSEGGGRYAVDVNGHPHQTIVPVSQLLKARPIYAAPYAFQPQPPLDRVLIIGAGTGNDVAVALAEGAQRVDAVEIDPRLYQIGLADNTDRPYQNPAVHVYITDGRAFLHDTNTQYDMILFALPDSLTMISGQSSIRLESYLLTLQAMQEAKAHLAPGGIFAMYNYYTPFVLDRYAGSLQQIYGRSPCIQTGSSGTDTRPQAALVVSNGPLDCPTTWRPLTSSAPPPATDDHPFPYLLADTIPGVYLLALLAMLVGAVLAIRRRVGSLAFIRHDADLFFMGAAFLLIETKTVTQFALLFGTTWVVNALVFFGVLLSVLIAVSIAKRFKLPRPWVVYAALFVALLVSWAVPQESLLSLSFLPRFAAAASLAFAPVLLANLLFAQRFATTESSTVAFGANLLGAMVGGALEYAALVVGYRALGLLALALYAAALIAGRRRSLVRLP